MIQWQNYLTHHGQAKDTCEMVVSKFDNENFADNMSVVTWVQASKACLYEKHGVQEHIHITVEE